MTDTLIDKARELAKLCNPFNPHQVLVAFTRAQMADTLHALIARLEAAEKVCEACGHLVDEPLPGEVATVKHAWQAWRAIRDAKEGTT